MNNKVLKAVAIVAPVLSVLFGLLAWERQQAVSQALERARKAEAAITRSTEARDRAAWEQLEEDAALLAGDVNGTDRKVASRRFRETLRRLKSRYGYPQLGNEP